VAIVNNVQSMSVRPYVKEAIDSPKRTSANSPMRSTKCSLSTGLVEFFELRVV
jgi:hypothetical protein